MKSLIFVFFLFFAAKSPGATLRLGLESITPNVGGYQIDESGGDEFFSFNPGVRVESKVDVMTYPLHLGGSFFLPITSEDSLYDLTYIKLDSRYRIFSKERIQLFLGLGLYTKVISGSGENLTLQNGNSTSSFYGPSQTKLNYFFAPEFSSRFFFSQELAPTLSISIQDLFESERFSWNLLIDLTWRLF